MVTKIVESIHLVVRKFIEIVLTRLVLSIFWCVDAAEVIWDAAKVTDKTTF